MIWTPSICSGWLMKPTTRPSVSTTVMVGRRCESLGSRSMRTWYPSSSWSGCATGDQVRVAQGSQKPAGPVVVHHRHHRDVTGLEHDGDFAGHRARHGDMRIGDH